MSLPLHSRDTVPHLSNHTDYRSLTLSRLRRDAARAESIFARARLAAAGIKRQDLYPATDAVEIAVSQEAAMEGPVTSGSRQGSGEYFSRLSVGTPARAMYVVLDTGSDVTWVQCQPCTDCYPQADQIYDSAASSSYYPLSCGSPQCESLDVSACRNDTCVYQVNYGDGSYSVGDLATESVVFGSGSATDVAFGCGHDNEGLFVAAAGIIGLGGGELSFPSQIDARSFSYCLVDRDTPNVSTLDFNLDPAAPSPSVTAPMLRNRKTDTFYYVAMTGISVGGEVLSIPPSVFEMDAAGSGGVIVDSGTAITRMETNAYNAMRDAFVRGTGALPRAAGMALFDTCYDLSGRDQVEVPAVAFHFPEGKALTLPAKNYLIPVDSSGVFCFAFAPTESPLSIVGNVQQQGIRVTFDLERAVVGFDANQC